MIRLFKYPIHKGMEAAAMKIVESAQKCNPEQIAHKMSSIVEQLKTVVKSAAGDDQAYDQAMKNLGKIFGSDFSVDTAEPVNGNMGRSAGEFLDDLPMPEAGSEAKLLVASADCKGVPLVKDDSEKVAAFETAKKNPGNRRMATVTSVYSVEPNVRTAEDIAAALFRDEPDENAAKPPRPKPQNKNTTAHFPELAGASKEKNSRLSVKYVATLKRTRIGCDTMNIFVEAIPLLRA